MAGQEKESPERMEKMQLGIRLHDIKKAPLEERLAIAHEQGFACGHLALAKVISEYPVDDGALTPGYAMYLKKIFAANQLDVAVLGCYLNLANPNPASLAKNTHRYLAHIRFASLLGAGVVGTETGAVNEEYRFEERNHSEEALKIFINNLRPVVSYAEKMGVIVAIDTFNFFPFTIFQKFDFGTIGENNFITGFQKIPFEFCQSDFLFREMSLDEQLCFLR